MTEQLEKYHFCNWWEELERKGISHGYRIVEVRSVGPKWVYLREPRPKGRDRNRFSKISRKFWEEIKVSKFKTGLSNFKTNKQAKEELVMKNRLMTAKTMAKKGCQVELIFG